MATILEMGTVLVTKVLVVETVVPVAAEGLTLGMGAQIRGVPLHGVRSPRVLLTTRSHGLSTQMVVSLAFLSFPRWCAHTTQMLLSLFRVLRLFFPLLHLPVVSPFLVLLWVMAQEVSASSTVLKAT